MEKVGLNLFPGLAGHFSKLFPGSLVLFFPLALGFRLDFSPTLILVIFATGQGIAQANSRKEMDVTSCSTDRGSLITSGGVCQIRGVNICHAHILILPFKIK